jgi:hypothetical protein
MLGLTLLAGCTAIGILRGPRNAPPAAPQPTIGKLDTAEIQKAFGIGSPFTESVVGGKTYTITYNVDGTAKRTSMGSKSAEIGTWRAADLGYCAKWGKGAEQCYAVSRTASTSYDVLDAKEKVVAHLTVT